MSSSGGKQKKSKRSSSSSSSSKLTSSSLPSEIRSLSSSSTSQLPSNWSGWNWDINGGRWERYRLDAAGKYEFEYDPPETGEASTEPRSTPTLNTTILPSGGFNYQTTENYTTSSTTSVDTITSGVSRFSVAQTNVNSDEPQQSAQVLPSLPNHIRTRNPNTNAEERSPQYKVHQYWEFKLGRVFKVLWAEPKGSGGTGSHSGSSHASYTQLQDENGKEQFEKVRRFIIIKPSNGHCICLPINTYSRQGVTKRGVHAEDHTIVYSEKKPVYFHGEKDKGLTKKPLKIACSPRHKLDDLSRLNYAKTYTVEYNVKVCFIGKIDKKSEWYLIADFNNTHPPVKQSSAQPFDDEGATDYAGGAASSYHYSGNDSSSSSASASQYPLDYGNYPVTSGYRTSYDIAEENEDAPDDYEQYQPGGQLNNHSGDEDGLNHGYPEGEEEEDEEDGKEDENKADSQYHRGGHH